MRFLAFSALACALICPRLTEQLGMSLSHYYLIATGYTTTQ